MFVLGLTGSIGMGKSTAAEMLRRLGVPLQDADATVHRLLAPGGAAVPAVAALFPETLEAGGIDRRKLGARVFGNPAELRQLEAILHPLVRQAAERFLKTQARRRARLVCLDIPLLFETGAERRCDAVLLVTAPRWLQSARVLRRPGMTPEKLAAIRAQQMPEQEKLKRADFVVPSGLGKAYSLRRLRALVRLLKSEPSLRR